jgi:hypothetical protein
MERVLARQVAADLRRRLTASEQDAVSGAGCWFTPNHMTDDWINGVQVWDVGGYECE